MNITKNVPTIQLWQTTHKHYENLPKPILTEKNLHCEQIGERVNYYQDMQGIITVKETMQEVFAIQDIVLIGLKVVFYEKAIIMVD